MNCERCNRISVIGLEEWDGAQEEVCFGNDDKLCVPSNKFPEVRKEDMRDGWFKGTGFDPARAEVIEFTVFVADGRAVTGLASDGESLKDILNPRLIGRKMILWPDGWTWERLT